MTTSAPPTSTGEKRHQLASFEGLDQVGGGHRGDRKADAEDAGDQATLHGGHLVGQDRAWAASRALRKTCAMHQPTSTTPMFGASDGQGSDRAAGQAGDHPRASHAQG